MRSDNDRLRDIVDRIHSTRVAEALMAQAEAAGDVDLLKTAYDAILYDLLVIGEAAKALDDDFKNANDQVPWMQIVGMRNILAHEYFRVSSQVVHASLEQPLALLLIACEADIR